jgi:phage-related holin
MTLGNYARTFLMLSSIAVSHRINYLASRGTEQNYATKIFYHVREHLSIPNLPARFRSSQLTAATQ